MNDDKLREHLRPQGLPSPGCQSCHWRAECGGFPSGRLFGTCFDETCCHFLNKDKKDCNRVCPYKSDFSDWLRDVRGLRFDDLPEYRQPPIALPGYVPVIHHSSARRVPLRWPIVALNTYQVVHVRRKPQDGYGSVVRDGRELRAAFLVDESSKVLLRGVGEDAQLELYWENRLRYDVPRQLSTLAVQGIIGPNFSHFLDAPRIDHLFNRRRQLLCLAELYSAGNSIIPHLNAVTPADWLFWEEFLRRNETIKVVAVEFQTGNKNPAEGLNVLSSLAAIQRRLRRDLHLILVGGSQFVERAAGMLAATTLMDSNPFMKTMRRFRFGTERGKASWQSSFSLIGQPLDQHLAENVAAYSAWIEARTRGTIN